MQQLLQTRHGIFSDDLLGLNNPLMADAVKGVYQPVLGVYESGFHYTNISQNITYRLFLLDQKQ